MTANKREKIRGTLLAALMVASVFAAAAPASAAVASGDRTVSSTTVAPGGSTTVTVTATMDGDGGSLSLNEFFSGEVAGAAVRNVTVDGSSASPIIANANENTAVVTLSGLPANANVEVTYVVNATSSTGMIDINGNLSGDGTIDLGTDAISVESSTSAIESADRTADSSVSAGGDASVTVSARLNASGGGFSLNEAFSGDIADASIDNVTVDGSSASPIIANANSNAAVVTLASVPGNANVEVTYTVTAASTSPGSITIEGNASSSGTVDLGTDTVSVTAATGPSAPAEGSYSAGGYVGDNTRDLTVNSNFNATVANLDFSSNPGNVENVTVDPTAGASANNVSDGDISQVRVNVEGDTNASQVQNYNGSPLDFNFGSISGVTEVNVFATTTSNVDDGDAIDAGVELGIGGSTFSGTSGLYDTAGVQTVSIVTSGDTSYVSAEVRDRNGEPVTTGRVQFLRAGALVDEVSLDAPGTAPGETPRVNVPRGTYTAVVVAPGFKTFSATRTVDIGETEEIDVTLEPIDILDRIEVTPEGATAIADEESITYTVTTFDKDGDRLSGVTVDASDDNADIVFTSSTTATTNANGQATFTVTSPVIATGTLTFTARNASGGPDQSTPPDATFIRSGEGAIDGQVLDSSTTSALPNATVYAVLESRWSNNRFSTVVDLSSLSLTDDDSRIFVRLVDRDSGEIIDNDKYDVRTRDESGTGVRQVESLNKNNAAVGEGFALVDIDGDEELDFSHTRLTDEDYYAQVSLDASEASDERVADNSPEAFVNVSGYDATGEVTSVGGVVTDASDFDPSTDLTASATRGRAALSGANLVDTTDADGDFKLTKLFTEYQLGRDYVVVAQKVGYSTDIADVFVQEDGSTFEDRVKHAFNLSPEEVKPAEVNITQIGLHPPLSATGGAPDMSQVRPFPNQSDDFVQEVPRDGETVDVVEIETLDEDGNRINGTAEVAVEDFGAFGGSWNDTTYGGTTVSTDASQDQITINTGSDGVATLLLFTDLSSVDLLTNKTAVLTNDRSATDNTTVRFLGQVDFRDAAISGIVTDTNDDPVQDSVAYAEQFTFPTDASRPGTTITRADQSRFTVEPTAGIDANAVDDDSDTFEITRQRWDGTSWVDVTSTTVTRSELANYRFPDSDFPGVTVNITSGDGFKLLDIVELGGGTDPDASYTLDPLPAVRTDTEADSTEYSVRAIKLTDPNASATRFGLASVQPGSTDDANVALPVDVTEADLQVTRLSAPSSAVPGDNITVTADITNIGGTLGQVQQAEFRIDQDGDGTLQSDETKANMTVDVDPSTTETVTFDIDTSSLASGTYTHGVATNDDIATASIDIRGSASFEVSNLSAPSSVSQGDTMMVDAAITNTGSISATKPVSLTINGTNVSTGTGSVDILFAIDTSGSMSDEISAVRNGLTSFTNTLESQGVNVRYAVLTFADQVPYNVRQNYTSNVTRTQQTLDAISTGGALEQSWDVANDSIDIFDERAGAQEYFLIFTDEDADTATGDVNDPSTLPGSLGSTPTASDVASRLDAEGVRLFGITQPEPQLDVGELSIGRVANRSANGQYFNINDANFAAKFENEIAGTIANASAGQQLTLASGETDTATFSIAGSTTSNLAPGDYTIEVSTPDDSASTSLQVTSGCPLSSLVESYDTNGDCAIDVTELGQAGSDYATGAISVTELGQVGSAYASTST